MPDLGHKETHAPHKIISLFDNLIGASKQRRRHIEAERLRGLDVDHQFVLGRSLHRKVGRLLALEDAVDAALAVLIYEISPVGDQAAVSGKWLELLRQIALGVTRVAVLREPAITAGIGQFSAIQATAQSLGVEVSPVGVRDTDEIARAVAAFARSPDGGLIVTGSGQATAHRDLIVTLAARYKLPAVYFERSFPAAEISNLHTRIGWDAQVAPQNAMLGRKERDCPLQSHFNGDLGFCPPNLCRALQPLVNLLAQQSEIDRFGQ